MQSDRDLLAQWAGEELFAAERAARAAVRSHRERGEFYVALLRQDMPSPRAAPTAVGPIGQILAAAFQDRDVKPR